MELSVFLTGLAMGLSLIVAIGAQNAFVLRQGLRGEHILVICLICIGSDIALITLGVGGFGSLIQTLPWLEMLLRYGGAAFLIIYGARSLYSALFGSGGLEPDKSRPALTLPAAVMTCLALTWLNPHTYLDTVVFLGAVSTRFPDDLLAFGTGAATASLLFFFALGYGARYLRPIFADARAWRVLEAAIALIMWTIAFQLVSGSGSG
ncbi:LysE/ArgO family amino acid transporter [Ketogulonicigenium vulgare]|uniref:LysE/ArgO family amino acid transporter n=1 Tax=Ketogulonicigenium vulgare TaxID=92945 RepID=UPI002358C520|nr:LysE/ArgO family amino acid transporter [Ketogulonicigenium vulgare]